MAGNIKATFVEELSTFKALAQDVAKSGAYLYPVKGIVYFASHKDLWRPFLSRASQTITLGLGVTTAMFFFTYIPQATIMAFTSGPLAPISAALLVLSESSTITNWLARTFFLQDTLTDTFDGTLIARGHEALVAEGRQVRSGSGSGVARLGKMVKQPLMGGRSALWRSLVLLPMNFVPLVGTVMYVFVQGGRLGRVVHLRYFQLKGWDKQRWESWVESHRGGYTGYVYLVVPSGLGFGWYVLVADEDRFGIAAFLFEMVPFASLVFSFTNTVGAALWAADIEKGMK